jgi:hypothetical protein
MSRHIPPDRPLGQAPRPEPVTIPEGFRITKLPPGAAHGADDLTKWASQRNAGRSGVVDEHAQANINERLRKNRRARKKYLAHPTAQYTTPFDEWKRSSVTASSKQKPRLSSTSPSITASNANRKAAANPPRSAAATRNYVVPLPPEEPVNINERLQ